MRAGVRRWDNEEILMLGTFPGLLLVIMIALTLILLPRLTDERPSSPETVRHTEGRSDKPRRHN